MSRLVLFIDRDGTLIEEPDDFQVDRLDQVRLAAGAIPALLQLKAFGYSFVMVSNQDGLGTDALQRFGRRVDHGLIFDGDVLFGVLFIDHRKGVGISSAGVLMFQRRLARFHRYRQSH